MKKEKIIIMFTYSPFPFGEATSNRILSLALGFQDSGYKVIVLCNGSERIVDYNEKKKVYMYKGIEYRNFERKTSSRILRVINRNNINKIIEKKISKDELNRTEIVYATYRNYSFILHYMLKKHFKIPAVVDVTEWHSSDQYKFRKFSLAYLLHDMKIRILIPKAKNIICITTFLENYFKAKLCNTIVIPPQIDINSFQEHKLPLLPNLKLFYAGTSAKKDYLDVALEGLCELSQEELKQIKCTLVGQNINDFKKQFARSNYYINTLKDSLEILDRLPKAEIDKKLSEEHFLILMRPYSRYSKAGFPSKVPEALAAGVPIITNLTSDLGLYIKDGINGLIVSDFSSDAFASTVRKALLIQNTEYKMMSQNAVKTAEEHFNYDVYTKRIKNFFDLCQL
ncbi:hypothetical protein CF394_13985 [Tetzosporium hominis]|uniref:Glycosyl transferase family 1 domain-containing protein n=1 Tax=Tetzosporium hominis TaxID=2020506 RepID=A0A264W040_9BACL|nr:glycosyltransferase [Tetzosporium hominis]OZS76956.1 hypothetical protein CF394_13985 [Tetzosporium hominis]